MSEDGEPSDERGGVEGGPCGGGGGGGGGAAAAFESDPPCSSVGSVGIVGWAVGRDYRAWPMANRRRYNQVSSCESKRVGRKQLWKIDKSAAPSQFDRQSRPFNNWL